MNMKKKILLALIAILLTSPAWAKNKEQKLEEVVLDVPQEEMNVEEVPQAISVTEEKAPQEKSLKEKLQDVYHLEVYKYDKPTYLLQDVLTHKFDAFVVNCRKWVSSSYFIFS